ncbi:hypothetical protein D9758_003098 [Tetrapyrgos nigripes]|uniref:F-box domain-containing protein n=1 Tax=Tetrapyrgos nigripes TaxID=182062 RepID=A0A8H5GPX0_9AGAR|nr:hypothetical protein D9758_003098 [Tetrapyrgos nigripes]
MLSDAEINSQQGELEISQLRSRVLHLQEKQKLLDKHVEQLKSLSAPIRRLPVDTLIHCFAIFCENHPILFSRRPSEIRSPPFALASVCNGWRQVVIATSQLWSNFKVSADLNKSLVPRFEAPLRLCLERSKSYPLSIDLRLNHGESNLLVSLLVEHSSRWRHAQISSEVSRKFFPGLCDGRSFPLLETLNFRDVDPNLQIFNLAPRLRSLKLASLPAGDSLVNFTPRSQIASLEVACCDEYVFQELEKFPNLQSMVYSDLDHSYLPDTVAPQILPCLSTLEFRMGDLYYDQRSHTHNLLTVLLDNLTLPSLATLAITNHVQDVEFEIFKGVWPHEAIHNFMERSACLLLTLRLDQISLSDRDLIGLLRLTPSLVEFRVKEIYREDYNFTRCPAPDGTIFKYEDTLTSLFLSALHAYAYNHGIASPPLVPKLKRLELVADGNLFDDDLFSRMVVSRWIPDKVYAQSVGVTCLQSVKICVLGRTLQEEAKERLRLLKRAGLEFVDFSEEEDE